jgi:hypothetical protein
LRVLMGLVYHGSTPVYFPTPGSVVSTVPLGVAALTLTTKVNVAVANAFMVPGGGPQATVPTPPTGGVVQVKPAGAVNETKVVLAGSGSLRFTGMAPSG